MERRIYWILLIISSIVGLGLFIFKENVNPSLILGLLLVVALTFSASIHGIIAHTINPNLKGGLIFYPLLMGVIFSVLLFIFIFTYMHIQHPAFNF